MSRSTNLFNRNHPTCFVLRREDRHMPIIEQLLYETDKSSHPRCSTKKATHTNFAKHMFWSLFWDKVKIKLQVVRLAIFLKRDSNTDIFLWILQHFWHLLWRTSAYKNASENNKKRFLGKATSPNDHYMINMGSQRPKIGGNWPLTGPYLQRYFDSWLVKFKSETNEQHSLTTKWCFLLSYLKDEDL